MVGVVVAAHGRLAHCLVEAATAIVGEQPALLAVDLPPSEGLDDARRKIEAAIARVDGGRGVVVLADLFGGTPANCCLTLLEQAGREMVTGVNLPMLLRVAAVRQRVGSPAELAAELVAYGRRNIADVREMLGAMSGKVRR